MVELRYCLVKYSVTVWPDVFSPLNPARTKQPNKNQDFVDEKLLGVSVLCSIQSLEIIVK